MASCILTICLHTLRKHDDGIGAFTSYCANAVTGGGDEGREGIQDSLTQRFKFFEIFFFLNKMTHYI